MHSKENQNKTAGRKQRQSGMSLIEVLVSIAMIGGLIVLYAAAFNVAALTKKMRNENLAYHIASKKMEELRQTPYASLPSSSPFSDTELSSLPSSSANFSVGNFGTYTGMKELVVTVNWNDGLPRSVVIRSLAGTGGINQ